MAHNIEPSTDAELRLRMDKWPPDGTYHGIPCTCDETCQRDCKGDTAECRCEACHMAHEDYLWCDFD